MATPMHPVNSSQLSYIGYDDKENTMYVTFKNGTTFKYFNVTKDVYVTLLNSPSVGVYFNSIKGNYKYEKVV